MENKTIYLDNIPVNIKYDKEVIKDLLNRTKECGYLELDTNIFIYPLLYSILYDLLTEHEMERTLISLYKYVFNSDLVPIDEKISLLRNSAFQAFQTGDITFISRANQLLDMVKTRKEQNEYFDTKKLEYIYEKIYKQIDFSKFEGLPLEEKVRIYKLY